MWTNQKFKCWVGADTPKNPDTTQIRETRSLNMFLSGGFKI